MIAVTFALPIESSDFRRVLDDHHREVTVLHTGVGAEVCRKRIGPFLDTQRFDFLISSGFAGGVAPSLGVGDLILAENFSDPALLGRAREALISHVAKLATADRIIESPVEREQFARQHSAAAVDMETEWVARACAARKIPMLSLRVISDTAAAPFPAPPTVLFDLGRQKTDGLKLTAYLACHPFGVVRLMRFARQIAFARANLAAALSVLVRELP